MKTKTLVFIAILLIVAGFFSACENNTEFDDAITRNYYVFSIDRDGQCGYLLFEETGSLGHYHDRFVWAENLPERYQVEHLPVSVTFYNTEEICSGYPIINIVKIQEQ